VLLTRSPLDQVPKALIPFDLHVLGTPPAFVLSQDQTLHPIPDGIKQKVQSSKLFGISLFDCKGAQDTESGDPQPPSSLTVYQTPNLTVNTCAAYFSLAVDIRPPDFHTDARPLQASTTSLQSAVVGGQALGQLRTCEASPPALSSSIC
jgi:hypothetical protein